MKKLAFFLILFFASIFFLAILLIAGFMLTPPTSTQTGWVDNMWSCMGDWMRGNYPVTDPLLNIYGILLIVIAGIAIIGVAGLTYFYLFPEIKNVPQPQQTSSSSQSENQNLSSYESVLKTLNEDEHKVLTVLKNHNGTYLQKYIRHEAGLSRLKTHRILARFAERGMVTLEKTGNTNQVTLAEWLK
ncbi:MAG: hypothetical protein NUK63_09315 [Candidatus Bathyarchaeum tardum]|nr:MAG: hypothetical protein NUK63_09315 [Candidatus Bathyarchaeum tardum]